MAEKKRVKRFYDISLVVMVFSITLFGLLMLYSASSYMAEKNNMGEMYYLKRQPLPEAAFSLCFSYPVLLTTISMLNLIW